MRGLQSQLARKAIEFANSFRGQLKGLQEKLSTLQQQELETQASLEAANLAIKRADDFEVTIGGDYQCPRCWIINGVHASLIPQDGGEGYDRFLCRTCRETYDFAI